MEFFAGLTDIEFAAYGTFDAVDDIFGLTVQSLRKCKAIELA